MPGVRCSQRSDLSAQRPPSRPQAGRGRRWSDGDHLGRPFLRRLFVITELGQILPLADLPSTTDVPPSGRTTRPVVYAQPDHACPPGQAAVEPPASQRQRVDDHREPSPSGPRRRATHCWMSGRQLCVLTHGEPRTAAVSDAVAIEVDVAQYTANEGPCLDAARTSRVVRVDQLGAEERFCRFGPRAQDLGIQAVLSVPATVAATSSGRSTCTQHRPSPRAPKPPRPRSQPRSPPPSETGQLIRGQRREGPS